MWLSAGFGTAPASAPRLWWALAANGFLDGAITAAFIATASVRQQRTPRHLLGRVAAASTVCNAAARVVRAAGVGLLLHFFGPRTALVTDAVLLGLAACYVTIRPHEARSEPTQVVTPRRVPVPLRCHRARR
jgi:hypothetical protein